VPFLTSCPANQGILDDVWKYKLIFVETPDGNETSIALENYRRVGHSRVANTRSDPLTLLFAVGMQQRSWCSAALCRSRQSLGRNRFRPQLWTCCHHVWVGYFYFHFYFRSTLFIYFSILTLDEWPGLRVPYQYTESRILRVMCHAYREQTPSDGR